MRSFYWIVYASIPTSDLSEPNCSSSSVGLTPIVILSTDHTTADKCLLEIHKYCLSKYIYWGLDVQLWFGRHVKVMIKPLIFYYKLERTIRLWIRDFQILINIVCQSIFSEECYLLVLFFKRDCRHGNASTGLSVFHYLSSY